MSKLINICDQILQESNLARLLSHTNNRNIGLISASRAEYTKKENLKNHNELKSIIRDNGYGYIPVTGNYIENYRTSYANPVTEKTFIIIGDEGEDNNKLKNFIIHHGIKYSQDSVLYKKYNTNNAILIGTNNGIYPGFGKEISVGEFRPDKIGETFSMLKNKKTFMFTTTE